MVIGMSTSSPNKKRKLIAATTKSSTLSAFAARRALNNKINGQGGQGNDDDVRPVQSLIASTASQSVESLVGISSTAQKNASSIVNTTISKLNKTSLDNEDILSSLPESRAVSLEIPPEKPSIALSNFKPGKDNIRSLAGDSIGLKLEPGERLVILGQYELSVRKGQITLMGATLQPSKRSYRVCALSTHALPVIRCLATDINGADIRLRQCENGLRSLSYMSPLYGRIWNDDSGPIGPENSHILRVPKKTSFQILFSSKDGPQKSFLQPLISPPAWNEMLAKCSAPFENRTRRVLICGPKSSGKSTFAKLLVNKLLSTSLEMTKSTSNERHSGVALMDIDPGQPEYCPPGQLALVHVQEPNFGPPFAHPMPGPKSKIIRSHSIGAVSPSLDPELYMSCALDLFAHYKKLLAQLPNCPLVINTPGWVLGTGLEILVDLIANIRPTEVIYMSKDGPPEVVESLAEVAVAIPVLTLPSQSSEYTTRTAAHLRTMQYMSYFHIDPLQENHAAWMPQPLTTMRPWEIRYTGQNPGIKGIICYGEQPPPSLVAETINGSLVSVVVLDDMTAIPGWHQGKGHEPFERETDERVSGSNARYAQPAIIDSACVDLPPKLQSPLIVRTPEDIPYFNPGNSITLDPSTSQSIGLALVRGIDRERHQIQILTPIHPGVINDINKSGKAIVLVSGKLDTPGWAYIEELNQKMALEKPQKQNDVDASVGDGVEVEEASEDNDASDMQMTMVESLKDAPWIEKLQGSEGRGVGSRVWRVRRDLGRADGGD